MEPVISVTVGGVLAVGITNLVWWRSLRKLGGRRERAHLMAELRSLKARLVGQHLALVEAVGPVLAAKEGTPSTPGRIISRMVRGHRDNQTEIRQLRSQLGNANRRVAKLKHDVAELRQSSGTDAMGKHLAHVAGERDALKENVADLTVRVRRGTPTTRDALHAARQEIERLRAQLRGANRAILALDVAPMSLPSQALPTAVTVGVSLEDHPTDPGERNASRPPTAETRTAAGGH